MRQRLRGRTYELQRGEWMLLDEPHHAPSRWRRIAALFAGAFAISAMAAIGIVATAIALLLLPIGLFVAWRLSATSRHAVIKRRSLL